LITTGDPSVPINTPGAVEVDAMFDSPEIVVDNDKRSA